jgi:hypothetical protein
LALDFSQAAPKFRIRLHSGRVVGPLGLAEVYALIRKGHVTGVEQACQAPSEDWRDINDFPLIAEGLLAMSEGRVSFLKEAGGGGVGELAPTVFIEPPPEILPLPGAENRARLPDKSLPTHTITKPGKLEDRTQLTGTEESTNATEEIGVPKFELQEVDSVTVSVPALPIPKQMQSAAALKRHAGPHAKDETVLLEGVRRRSIRILKWRFDPVEFMRATAIAVLLGLFGYEFVFTDLSRAR